MQILYLEQNLLVRRESYSNRLLNKIQNKLMQSPRHYLDGSKEVNTAKIPVKQNIQSSYNMAFEHSRGV